MILLLLAWLARPCLAQTLPQAIQDPAQSEVSEHLGQEVRRLRQDVTNASYGGLGTDNTWTGINLFGSSVTLSGKLQGNTSNSSWTIITPGLSFTTTTLGSCSLSTVTLTLGTAGLVMVSFSGATAGNGSVSYIKLSPVVDGAFPSGLDSTYSALTNAHSGVTDGQVGASFAYPVALAAGSHTFCLSASVNAGTGYLGSATAGHENRAKFGAYEVR